MKRTFHTRANPSGLLVLLFLAGCSAGTNVVGSEHFAFRGPMEEESRLRLEGYYYHVERPKPRLFTGTRLHTFLLWSDGTAAFIAVAKHLDDSQSTPHRYGTVEEAHEELQEYLRNPERLDPLAERWGGANWGAFRIRGDSLIIHVLRPSLGTFVPRSYNVFEFRGRVLSDTSFVLAEYEVLSGPYERGPRWLNQTYTFYPFGAMPPSTNWTQTHPDLQPKSTE